MGYELESARRTRRVYAVRRDLVVRVRRCIPCKLRPVRPILAARVTVWADGVVAAALWDVLKLAGLGGLLAVLLECHP